MSRTELGRERCGLPLGRPVPKEAEWCREARAPGTQDGFASSQEVLLEQNPPKQNSFTANIFLPVPLLP